jgi:hypothetical protein
MWIYINLIIRGCMHFPRTKASNTGRGVRVALCNSGAAIVVLEWFTKPGDVSFLIYALELIKNRK